MRKQRGFALLELTAAVMLITLALGTSLVVLAANARNVRDLFEEKVAMQLASGELELLEARGFEGVEEGATALAAGSPALAQLREGRCTLEVSRDREDVTLLCARVVVRWRSGPLPRQVEVDTCYRPR